jgi:CRISPR-associated protein Cas2
MVALRRPFHRPLVHRVLPADFLPPPAPIPQSRVPNAEATAPSSQLSAQGSPPDWFPILQPTASDLSGHRCGALQMLTLVAYDICNPKRLHRAAKVCEDWGMRIQYSVFECRLEAQSFALFWDELSAVIDPKDDRIVAYKICTKCAREIHSLGTQVHNEKVVAYVC